MNSNVRNLTQIAVFTAVLCVFSPLTFTLPISPVPIVIVNLFIYIFSVVLGSKKALLGFFVHLLLGAVGLPVFSYWNSGVGHIFGPTGGYLIGYVFCLLGASLGNELGEKISHNKIVKTAILTLGMVVGTFLCYLVGSIWLAYLNDLDFYAAVVAGVIPFIPGDAVKIVIAVILSSSLKERIKKKNY